MIGYTVNNRGRYKCDFCDHRTYKTHGGVMAHIETNHFDLYQFRKANAELERTIAENERTIARLKSQPPKVEVREKVVYKDRPEPKFWYIENGGGIYCETCKIVQMRVGIPNGQTIENTPHGQCGNRTLKLVLEVR